MFSNNGLFGNVYFIRGTIQTYRLLMKSFRILLTVVAVTLYVMTAGAVTVGFTGQSRRVLEVQPEKNTGLDKIYVAYNAAELKEMRLEGVSDDLSVSHYSTLGGGYAEPVAFTLQGNTAIIDSPAGNEGYIITENGRNTCIWLVDYSTQSFSLSSVSADMPQTCDNTLISVVGSGEAIHYYTIDGRRAVLSREIEVLYDTSTWDDDNAEFVRQESVKILEYLTDPITLLTPLYCSTEVTVTGDRFLKEWGMQVSATSPLITPNGIDARTTAVQTNLPEESEVPSNIINGGNSQESLGGSAPADIKFTAYVTEGVIHDEWQMSSDPEFQNVNYRWNEREVEYSFQEEGVFYIRYVGSNADGTCEVYGDVYTVSIGASELRIPNAFTPNDDGVNDVWKVGYRSLLDFKCWIFDRYGNQLYYFDDPDGGWDGKYKGKVVKPGVYFYVLEAKGSDGKKYKKGGDINIIGYKRIGTQTTTPTE